MFKKIDPVGVLTLLMYALSSYVAIQVLSALWDFVEAVW
jgi:hypothetical protein